MQIAPLPDNEQDRLEALLRYDILDTGFEQAYDELTKLAAYICDTPIALISLIDDKRQWFKSKVGLDANETPRDLAFCAHAVLQPDNIFVVNDALKDQRFFDNPLVKEQPAIRFYAGAPLVTPDGYALGTLCAIDRIPRELNEKQLAALETLSKQVISQLELHRAVLHLKQQAQELHALNASKDKFFAIISHDLKVPFHSILGLSELLETRLSAPELAPFKELATSIHNSAKNTYKLLENLLQWSLLETGKTNLEPVKMALNALIFDSINVLYAAAKNKSLQLHSNLDGMENITVFADAHMMHSVLRNLISNAIKFSPPGRDIEVSADILSVGGCVKITVSDNGVGMSEQHLRELFQTEYYTNTNGTQGEQGTGLGLLLCKQFIERNGGTIQAESEKGKGSVFSFTIPLAETS